MQFDSSYLRKHHLEEKIGKLVRQESSLMALTDDECRTLINYIILKFRYNF